MAGHSVWECAWSGYLLNKGRKMDIAKDIVITTDNLTSIKFWIMQEITKG